MSYIVKLADLPAKLDSLDLILDKIVEGDCLDLMRRIPDGCVDAIVTDPPYGINLQPQRGLTKPIDGDTPKVAKCLWVGLVGQSARILEPNTTAMFFSGWSECDWVKPLLDGAFETKSLIVWVKNRFGIGYYTRPQHEFIWYCWKGIPAKPDIAPSNVWNYDIEQAPIHSCQKPVGLLAACIRLALRDGMVFDPFLGSGTTAVAAKKLGRHFIGCEINPDYCKIAEQRLVELDAQPGLFNPQEAVAVQRPLIAPAASGWRE